MVDKRVNKDLVVKAFQASLQAHETAIDDTHFDGSLDEIDLKRLLAHSSALSNYCNLLLALKVSEIADLQRLQRYFHEGAKALNYWKKASQAEVAEVEDEEWFQELVAEDEWVRREYGGYTAATTLLTSTNNPLL